MTSNLLVFSRKLLGEAVKTSRARAVAQLKQSTLALHGETEPPIALFFVERMNMNVFWELGPATHFQRHAMGLAHSTRHAADPLASESENVIPLTDLLGEENDVQRGSPLCHMIIIDVMPEPRRAGRQGV
jgi:hypothetical protein